MRILLLNRKEAYMGGDINHVKAYELGLRKLGYDAVYDSVWTERMEDYDEVWLMHINFQWTWGQYLRCKELGKPYRITAIFSPTFAMDLNPEQMKEVLLGAKKVYCLSQTEGVELMYHIKTYLKNLFFIENGVHKKIFNKEGPKFIYGKDGYVMAAGRWEELKGHHLVIEACKRLNVPVIIIGQARDGTASQYKAKCHKMYDNAICLDNISSESLADYYRGARVFVSGSAGERNSLVILEAAACGTPIVSTKFNRGNEWYNFTVADPNNTEELMKCILKEWHNPTDHSESIKDWDEIVEIMMKDV